MFTPLSELSPAEQSAVLGSLGAPEAWTANWDIGLTDSGDSFSRAPLWGRVPVGGRWPAAFPRSNHNDQCPWRSDWHVHFGHVHPIGSASARNRSLSREAGGVAVL